MAGPLGDLKPVVIVSLSIPAGTYVLNAKVRASAYQGKGYLCHLQSDALAGDLDTASVLMPIANTFVSTQSPLQATAVLAVPSLLKVICENVDPVNGIVTSDTVLTAIRVSSLTVG